jgi:hypothetical protein
MKTKKKKKEKKNPDEKEKDPIYHTLAASPSESQSRRASILWKKPMGRKWNV